MPNLAAIHEAIANPRELDLNLVRAQESRRIVDRLFGSQSDGRNRRHRGDITEKLTALDAVSSIGFHG